MLRFTAIIILSLASLSAQALDSVSNTNPTLAQRTAVKGTACTANYEEAFAADGEPLFCMSGTWRSAGQNGYEKVSLIYYRKASDNYSTKTFQKYCPAGKVLIGSDCNFNGGTNMHIKPFVGSGDDRSAVCFFSLGNAYDPAYPGGIENSLVTTAYCVDEF